MANSQSYQDGDFHVRGGLSAGTMTIPPAAVTATSIAPDAKLPASTLEHRHCAGFSDSHGVTAAAQNRFLHAVKGATARVKYFHCGVQVLMTTDGSDDRTVTFTLKKQDGSAILTSSVTISKADAAKTPKAATIASPNLVTGDSVYCEMTVAGSVGTQALGAFAEVVIDEDAN